MQTFIECICDFCNQKFTRVRKNVIYRSKSKKTFCNKNCSILYRTKTVINPCGNCTKPVERTVAEYESSKSKKVFCNHSCAATYNNTHKKYGIRVSKLELFIKTKLSETYPDIEIHYNRKDAINSELDIYIPILGLAFELNGIFHYEPIYGADKLSKVKNNDSRKIQACVEKGIELCIVDVSDFTYFKKEKAMKYFSILNSFIKQKLNS
jgi:hypothetical protein